MSRGVTSVVLAVVGAVALRAVPGAQQAPPARTTVAFATDVQPILEKHCLSCHNSAMRMARFDLSTRESAIRGGTQGADIVPGDAERSRLYRRIAGLETPAMPAQGSPLDAEEIAAIKHWIDQGAVWESSSLTAAAATSVPGIEERPITAEERSYWAFRLPVQSAVPAVDDRRLTNPIDRFLEDARRKHGLSRAHRADRQTLVRRAYLDLLGLPPTPAQASAFVNDKSPAAWEHLIDSLLTSPHYGERYGRMWLDIARYADSAGFEYDMHRPNAWRYRDYVIKSFNDDKPYNRFLVEQIAGDEMDGKNDDTLIATGFLRMGPRVLFREKDNPERRYDYLDEILGTIGKGTLGLTVNCARCHNHKFDPITQKDYYALEASIFGYVETEVPLAPKEIADSYLAKNDEIDRKIADVKALIERIDAPYRTRLQHDQIARKFPESIVRVIDKPESERTAGEALLATQVLKAVSVPAAQIDRALAPDEAERKKELQAQIDELRKQRPAPLPMAEIATDGDYRSSPLGEGDDTVSCPKCRIPVPGAGPYLHKGPGRYEVPPSYFLVRGDVESHGPQMKPGFIEVITQGNPPTEISRPDGHTSGRRLALAQWIASPQNPMTARVVVNRIWQKHFGRGIVATLDNFGRMGDPPTHPELLDWLAVEFMKRGWSVKEMHRLIMTSEAYQMSSGYEDEVVREKDAQNQYLWRYRAQRLDAEIVRDSILAAGGNINLTIGGPPVFPPLPKELLTSVSHGIWKEESEGPDVWRRSVYVYRRRGLAFPMFQVFDLPEQNVSAGARNVSTVPTQALTLLNDPFVLGQARLFADRIKKEAGDDPAAQIDLAYRIALTRPPAQTELAVALDAIRKGSLVDLTHVLMNLNEFVYMR
jgi:Protein of unknown function (DUF1553)/Protein of unknown function (DUF1549)/Planctomycete cytochrome C